MTEVISIDIRSAAKFLESPSNMMTSSNGNIFRGTGPLCGEFTGHRRIPRTKGSDAELWCFLWSAPWINGWVNNREAGDLRRYRIHYDVIVMPFWHNRDNANQNKIVCIFYGTYMYLLQYPIKPRNHLHNCPVIITATFPPLSTNCSQLTRVWSPEQQHGDKIVEQYDKDHQH